MRSTHSVTHKHTRATCKVVRTAHHPTALSCSVFSVGWRGFRRLLFVKSYSLSLFLILIDFIKSFGFLDDHRIMCFLLKVHNPFPLLVWTYTISANVKVSQRMRTVEKKTYSSFPHMYGWVSFYVILFFFVLNSPTKGIFYFPCEPFF